MLLPFGLALLEQENNPQDPIVFDVSPAISWMTAHALSTTTPTTDVATRVRLRMAEVLVLTDLPMSLLLAFEANDNAAMSFDVAASYSFKQELFSAIAAPARRAFAFFVSAFWELLAAIVLESPPVLFWAVYMTAVAAVWLFVMVWIQSAEDDTGDNLVLGMNSVSADPWYNKLDFPKPQRQRSISSTVLLQACARKFPP